MESHQDAETVAHLKERYDALKGGTERSQCENHWQEIAELVSPRKLDFVGLRTPGEKRMNRVYDPTGIHANELLAAGLHGMATNPASKWFSLRMVSTRIIDQSGEAVDINELAEVQKYLSDVEEVMWQRIYQPGTNFTTSMHEVYLDLGSFGTGVLFVGQRESGGLMFECRPLSECLIDENVEGHVDCVYRVTDMTVRQMWQMRKTKDNPDGWSLSRDVLEKWDAKRLDEKIKIIHAVYPRAERDYTRKGPQDMPWASCYFEYETAHKLEESGFPEFPYLTPRWSKVSGEIYGRSPAMTALPDIKMLQAMELAKIKLLQKAADPPMWLKDDGLVGQARTMPGGINFWRGNPSDGVMLQPISLQGIQALVQDEQEIRTRILRTFYADLMQVPENVDMTATEYMQRVAERMRLLGPLIGRLEGEMLGPLVERVFGILSRMKLLPDAPEIMQGQEFSVEYVSPIATAQKQVSANGLVQVAQLIAAMVGPEMAPQVLGKRVNPDKVVDYLWDLFNNDPDLLNDEEQQQSNDQMAQLQQALQAGGPMADIVQKLAGGAKNLGGAVKDLGSAQAEPNGIDLGATAGAALQGAQQPEAGVANIRQYMDRLNGAST